MQTLLPEPKVVSYTIRDGSITLAIQTSVYERFGIMLEPEPVVV